MKRALAVPYHLGDANVSAGLGARRLAEAMQFPLLDIGAKASIEAVNSALASKVREGVRVIAAGNCNSCLGTLAGLDRDGLSVLWFDAHGDFNTPETSISGSFEGMCLHVASETLISHSQITLIGARDLDPLEAVRVAEYGLRVLRDEALDPRWPAPLGRVYVHVDLDVLDPGLSPGVHCRAPGGWTPEQLLAALARIQQRCTVEAAAVVNYDPGRDVDRRTHAIAVRILTQLLAD